MTTITERLLKLHEGVRLKPYRCTAGKLTIGVGRNLDDRGLKPDEVELLLQNDLKDVMADLDRELPWWRNLNDPRKYVLIDMCFNLGLSRLLGFKNALKSMEKQHFVAAKAHMLDSLWARQVGNRAKRLGRMMELGEWPTDV